MVQTKIMWSWVLLDSARSYAFLDYVVATICLFFSDFTHIFRKYHLLLSLSLSYFRVFALSLLTSPRTQGLVLVINIQIILDSLSHFIRFFPFFSPKKKKRKDFSLFFSLLVKEIIILHVFGCFFYINIFKLFLY